MNKTGLRNQKFTKDQGASQMIHARDPTTHLAQSATDAAKRYCYQPNLLLPYV